MEMMQEVLSAIAQLSAKVDNVHKEIASVKSELQQELRDNHAQTIGILASHEMTLERISKDVAYLVGKEADNSHQIFLINKTFNRKI